MFGIYAVLSEGFDVSVNTAQKLMIKFVGTDQRCISYSGHHHIPCDHQKSVSRPWWTSKIQGHTVDEPCTV
jgi:hypothetical protein